MNPRRYDILSCLALVAAAALLYAHSLAFDLTYLDDNVWLIDYRWYLRNITDLGGILLKPDVLFGGLFYRPMIYLSFILDTRWAAEGFTAYRVTNIALHGINSCLVYAILRVMAYDRRLVTWSAMCFAVHPVLAQAVVWIPGRTDSLLAVFVFAGFGSFVMWCRNRRSLWLAAHAAALAGALLTKETAVVLPVICGLYVVLCARGVRFPRGWIPALVLWAIMPPVYLWLRGFVVGDLAQAAAQAAPGSVWHNLPAFLPYLGKIFLPVNLSVLPALADMTLVYGAIVLAGLILLSLTPLTQDRKRLLFGALWFVIFLLPSFVLSFIEHEYRIYVPLLGILIVILETGVPRALLTRSRPVAAVAAVATVLILGAVNVAHARHFRNRLVYWESAVATSPSAPLAHRNLGAMYFLDNRYAEAERAFLRARELNPREVMVNNNLGVIYDKRGEEQKAEEAYRQEIKINPLYDNVYYNLGLLYARQEKYDLAVAHWRKAADLNPRNTMAYKYLAYYYVKTNQPQAAAPYLAELQRRGVAIPDPIDLLIRP
ncbi:MAG: tetratricopeptide repeat protein [Candidatus Omnitrophica bacterium]|nr:tetratricopeptide repeat protein [Candidatus Omnitrophota bacterium]MCB9719521.1 tetratricopeptide repeat protein [Candidatus Omnitrophota bacterium]